MISSALRVGAVASGGSLYWVTEDMLGCSRRREGRKVVTRRLEGGNR